MRLPRPIACYCDRLSINDLLREMPVEHVRWSAGAQGAAVESKLESLNDTSRECAKREVPAQALFNHAILPLPLAEIQPTYFWLSGSSSVGDDYLLKDAGLNRRFQNGACDFTNDQAAVILLAYRRAIRPGDITEASGSGLLLRRWTQVDRIVDARSRCRGSDRPRNAFKCGKEHHWVRMVIRSVLAKQGAPLNAGA